LVYIGFIRTAHFRKEHTEFIGRAVMSVVSSFVVSLVDDPGTSSTGVSVRYVAEWPGDEMQLF
jgi:hypothetical protein